MTEYKSFWDSQGGLGQGGVGAGAGLGTVVISGENVCAMMNHRSVSG